LVGQSGAGKTLLLIKLIKGLSDNNYKTNFDIVMVRLRELSLATNNQQ
jgi:GTPase SAR1 family protein